MTRDRPLRETPKPAKSHAVAHELRQRIVNDLAPGSQLPTFSEMERTFGVSRGVLREAVGRLKQDGFIYSVDRRGLYVADNPPHLGRVGLVFPQSPASPTWPRFFTALQQEAAGIQESDSEIRFATYCNVTRDPHSEAFDQLCRDVHSHRLACLLLMPGAHEIGQVEPIASAAVPTLYICGATEVGYTPSITVDIRQMYDRMAQWLAGRGRTRLAAVGMYENSMTALADLRKRGVIHQPHWGVTVARENAADVGTLVSLLMDYPEDERPDGLMILDDNLTEYAIAGLIDCHVRIGQDLDVIAHCNWPWPVPCLAPVQRIGFHARHVLELAIRTAEQIKQGLPPEAAQVMLPAVFEDEDDSTFFTALRPAEESR